MKILIHLLILRPILKFIFGVNVFGKEIIQDLNNYIIVANHNSHLDILLLFYILPARHIKKTHPVAAKEYFSKSKILFFLVNYLFDPVWITRDDAEGREKFWEEVSHKLDKQHNLVIFPEGTRGNPGELKSFKSGIGRISERYREVPIIPVLISGTEKSLPKRYSIPVPIWHNIVIGVPQVFQQSRKKVSSSLEKVIRELANNETKIKHKRRTRNRKPVKTIAFIGIDGSGKSTLSKNIALALSEKLKIARVSDTLKFYENGKEKQAHPFITENIRTMVSGYAKNAKSLKQYKIPKLTELLLRNVLLNEVKRWYHPDYLVMDGSPLLNLTSWAILYKEELFNEETCLKVLKILSSNDKNIPKKDPVYKQFPELATLKNIHLNRLNLPDMVIFLDVDPEVSIERINKRGENKQVHETLEKLSKLREAYHITCRVARENLNISVEVVSADNTIPQIEELTAKFIQENTNKQY